jgi:hypothetical protein
MESKSDILSEIYKKIVALKKSLKPDEIAVSVNDFNPQKTRLIKGDVDFSKSKITDLGVLEIIEGDAYFIDSKITDLGNLKYIRGYANFNKSAITDLGKLEIVGGDVYMQDSKVEKLTNLRKIGGQLHLTGNDITDFGKLETLVGGIYANEVTTSRLNNHIEHIFDWNIIPKGQSFIFKKRAYTIPKLEQAIDFFVIKKGIKNIVFRNDGDIEVFNT